MMFVFKKQQIKNIFINKSYKEWLIYFKPKTVGLFFCFKKTKK
jgi:hypothetical protein